MAEKVLILCLMLTVETRYAQFPVIGTCTLLYLVMRAYYDRNIFRQLISFKYYVLHMTFFSQLTMTQLYLEK